MASSGEQPALALVSDELPKHLTEIDPESVDWKSKSTEYWREVLTPERFSVCRGAATERPFSGKYCTFKMPGDYLCACCGKLLFSGDTKFDSGTGWPSFTEAVDDSSIEYRTDSSHGMTRTETVCARCGAHLGHVFDDGPPPSGRRFCINSVCLVHRAPKD